MKQRFNRWIVAGLLPYGAVLLGIYLFQRGWIAILLYHLFAALILLAMGTRPRLRSPGRIPLAAGLALVSIVGTLAIVPLWPLLDGSLVPLDDIRLLPFWPFALCYVAVNPWVEEIFWRQLLAERVSPGWIGDILFGGYHALVLLLFVPWPFAVAAAVGLAGVGTLWRQISQREGHITTALVCHVAADAGVVGCVYLIGVPG